MLRSYVAFLCVSFLAGCADPNVEPVPFQLRAGNDSVVLGANLRTITGRPRPIPERAEALPTICSEPSPDVAIAFTRTLSGNASFSEPSGPTAAGGFNSSQAELSTDLGGRTAGVLALRDGLSAACQAYVNGVLGQDAYALVLSQYGNVLVALAGTGTGGAAPSRYTAQESAVSALLVSCISEHDPTRLGVPTGGAFSLANPLLSLPRCKKLMDAIASGKLLKPAPQKAADAQDKKAITTPSVTVNVAPAKGA